MLRWVIDEQVYVFGFAVHLDQLRPEVSANFVEDNFKPLGSVSVKYLSSILCDEDQMNVQRTNTVSDVLNIA